MSLLNRYPEGSDLLMQLIVQRNGEFYPIVCVHPSFLHFVSIDLLSLFQKLTVSPFLLVHVTGFYLPVHHEESSPFVYSLGICALPYRSSSIFPPVGRMQVLESCHS